MYEKKNFIQAILAILIVLSLSVNAGALKFYNETVDMADSGLYSSLGYDSQNRTIHIAHVNDSTNYEDVRHCERSTGSWACEVVNSSPSGFYPDKYVSMDIDSSGVVHLSWQVAEPGLHLGYCNNSGGNWNCEIVYIGAFSVGYYSSIRVDSADKVHITHSLTESQIWYANNTNGSWANTVITSLTYSTAYNSLALDSNDKPHIVYDNKSATPDKLVHLYMNASGNWIIDQLNENTDGYTSIDMDSYNNLYISHILSGKLRYCLYTNQSVLSCENVTDASDTTSIDVDSNNNVHITFQDSDADGAGYCYNNGTWACTVNPGPEILYSLDRRIDTGDRTAHISYYDNNVGTLNYMVVYFNETIPISIDYSYDQGFLTEKNGTANITVYDEYDNSIDCNITLNTEEHDYSFANAESKEYGFNLTDGENTISVTCTNDANVTTTETRNFTTSIKNYILINEETGSPYTITDENISMFVPSKSFNFTFNSSVNSIYYVTNVSEDVRFTIEYAGLTGVITRDFDPALQTDDVTRVCVAPEQTLYEQIIYSSTESAVAVYSVFADCYVLMSYTKFAYSDALMARAFTMPKIYYLYTWPGGTKTVLGNIEGGVALEINLDLITFAQRTYTISILSEDLGISAYTNTTFRIYYLNQKEENDKIVITVKNGTTTMFSYTETTSPNDITIYFDHSAYNLTDNLLTLKVTKYNNDEETGSVTKLFYENGASGLLNPWVAILFSAILLFFSLTFVAVRYVFGYFGIVTTLIGLAILSLAPGNQYITLMQVIEIIMLVFIILLYKEEFAKIV